MEGNYRREGTTAKVSTEEFIIKKINKQRYFADKSMTMEKKKGHLLNELNILLKLSPCENSVKYIGFYEDKDNINIVMEKCNENLEEYLGNRRLSIDEIKKIISQLNNIFKVMRKEGDIVHRDIKLENILIKYKDSSKTDYTVKLCDYGNAKKLENQIKNNTSLMGTFITMAPEVLNLSGDYDNKIDLFSLGIVLYQLSEGKDSHPFAPNYMMKIHAKDDSFPLTQKDRNFDDLLTKLLKFDPKERISWEEYFNHPFFGTNNNSNVNQDKINSENLFNVQYSFKIMVDNSIENTNKLKELNELVNQKISLEDRIIEIVNKDEGNRILQSIADVKFSQLKKIKLISNNITDIKALTNPNLVQLEELNLGNNQIEDISSFKNCKFIDLDTLNLNYNKIRNFSGLNFIHLRKLFLSNNQIADISVFGEYNFPFLKEMSLSYNKISNIDPLNQINLTQLNILDLSNNEISDIKSLSQKDYSELKHLFLNNNKIKNIDILQEFKMAKLEKLYLNDNNEIEDISVLSKCNFHELNELILNNNKIKNITVLKECNFRQLYKLDIGNNQIENIEIFSECAFPQLTDLYLGDNSISNIKVFESTNFSQLNDLDLTSNRIDDENTIDFLTKNYVNVRH